MAAMSFILTISSTSPEYYADTEYEGPSRPTLSGGGELGPPPQRLVKGTIAPIVTVLHYFFIQIATNRAPVNWPFALVNGA
jgi:hypothetical protein